MLGKLQSNWPERLVVIPLIALPVGVVAWLAGLVPFAVPLAVLGLLALAGAVWVGQRRARRVGGRVLIASLIFTGELVLIIAYSLLVQAR